MWILKKSKGYSLLEVMCSVGIFTMIITAMVPVVNYTFKIKNIEREVTQYSNLLHCIKNEMISNLDNEDLEHISSERKEYITSDKLQVDSLRENPLKDILVREAPDKKPYGEIIVENEDVYKIKIIIHYQSYNEEKEVVCEFVKGKY